MCNEDRRLLLFRASHDGPVGVVEEGLVVRAGGVVWVFFFFFKLVFWTSKEK